MLNSGLLNLPDLINARSSAICSCGNARRVCSASAISSAVFAPVDGVSKNSSLITSLTLFGISCSRSNAFSTSSATLAGFTMPPAAAPFSVVALINAPSNARESCNAVCCNSSTLFTAPCAFSKVFAVRSTTDCCGSDDTPSALAKRAVRFALGFSLPVASRSATTSSGLSTSPSVSESFLPVAGSVVRAIKSSASFTMFPYFVRTDFRLVS